MSVNGGETMQRRVWRIEAAAFAAWSVMLAGCSVGEGNNGSVFGSGGSGGPMDGSGTGADGGTDGSGSDGAQEGGEGADPSEGNADAYIEEAKEQFPTYQELHKKVIQRTCTPFNNVCHNNREYPDLKTPKGMLDRLGAPCNIVELTDDPLDVFNACEPEGDQVRFVGGGNDGFTTTVGHVEFTTDDAGNVVSAQVYLKEPIPNAMAAPGAFESIVVERQTATGMLSVGMVTSAVSYAPGVNAFQVNAWSERTADERSLLEVDVVPGDPNEDGIFGATDGEDVMRQILPGDPWNSYLLQRIQGTVPGSPMPLANQPLSSSEIIAIACWIEGAAEPDGDQVDSMIDYDGCEYAAQFGEPPEGSGASFADHVQPIFDARCATPGCHGTNAPAAGLDLSAGVARANLLEPATQNPDVPLVTPGNPTNSYLITKLTGAGLSGQQMPLGSPPLDEGELDVIRTWIIQGAADN